VHNTVLTPNYKYLVL